jgi:hypothetical protein
VGSLPVTRDNRFNKTVIDKFSNYSDKHSAKILVEPVRDATRTKGDVLHATESYKNFLRGVRRKCACSAITHRYDRETPCQNARDKNKFTNLLTKNISKDTEIIFKKDFLGARLLS